MPRCSSAGAAALVLVLLLLPGAQPGGSREAAAAAAAAPAPSNAAAKQLSSCLSAAGDLLVLAPSSAAYAANAARRNWQGRHDSRRPLAVAFPSDARAAAAAVRCGEAAGVPVVPRSGGHSYEAASLVHAGLVLDLSNLSSVAWAGDGAAGSRVVAEHARPAGAKAQVATVGAGTRLGVLYAALIAAGVMFPGGTCPGVGVSGFLLGGGQGHSVRALGLAADSVVGAQVVTADGSIVDANAHSHPDLLWAIKGGGPSYGVVTRWQLQTYAPPPVVTTLLVDTPLTVPALTWLLQQYMAWEPWSQPGSLASIDLRVEGDACGLKLVYWGRAADLKAKLARVALFRDAGRAIGARQEYHEGSLGELILAWTKASGRVPAAAAWDGARMAAFQTPAKLHAEKGYSSYRWSELDFAGAGFLLLRPLPADQAEAVAAVMVQHHLALHAAGGNLVAVAYLTAWGAAVARPPGEQSPGSFGWRGALINFQFGTALRRGNAADAGYGARLQALLLPLTRGALFFNYYSCLAGRDAYTNGSLGAAFFGDSELRLARVRHAYDPRGRWAHAAFGTCSA